MKFFKRAYKKHIYIKNIKYKKLENIKHIDKIIKNVDTNENNEFVHCCKF